MDHKDRSKIIDQAGFHIVIAHLCMNFNIILLSQKCLPMRPQIKKKFDAEKQRISDAKSQFIENKD